MSFLTSIFTSIAVHLRMVLEGLAAPFQIAAAGLSASGDAHEDPFVIIRRPP